MGEQCGGFVCECGDSGWVGARVGRELRRNKAPKEREKEICSSDMNSKGCWP